MEIAPAASPLTPRRLVERSGSALSALAAGDLWSQWPPRPARRPVGRPALVRGAPRAERRESRSPKSLGRDCALSYDCLPWRCTLADCPWPRRPRLVRHAALLPHAFGAPSARSRARGRLRQKNHFPPLWSGIVQSLCRSTHNTEDCIARVHFEEQQLRRAVLAPSFQAPTKPRDPLALPCSVVTPC